MRVSASYAFRGEGLLGSERGERRVGRKELVGR
jgi:hypothetical protein